MLASSPSSWAIAITYVGAEISVLSFLEDEIDTGVILQIHTVHYQSKPIAAALNDNMAAVAKLRLPFSIGHISRRIMFT
jgi:hypothetical protein